MRRTLLVLLMLIMSAQWTWAAVTRVCEHETGKSAVHLGHHEHQHVADAAEAADTPSPDTVVHADCATCHAGMSALLVAVELTPPLAAQDMGRTPYQRAVTQGLPEQLIRPPHLSH